MNWRGDKTLPWIYILFLMSTALFIGEVLPVVIGIFGGVFATYGAKEPIIKNLPDFGIVLIIYTVLGSLFWFLYRYIHWRIVALFAFVLTFILERWVYGHPEGEVGISNTISFGTIIQLVIVYLLVLVLPYGIFQSIRRKWAGRGIAIALIIVLALNILGLSFTAYVMVKRGLFPWRPITKQGQSENQAKANQTIYSDLKMMTPYVNENDITRIGPFGATANNPWGSKHVGIDFMTSTDLVPFQAVADGTIEKLSSSKENEQQGWHTEVCLNHNPFLVCSNFETFSADNAIGQRQSANIFVKNGDKIKQGEVIGKLVYGGEGAHIDVGVLLMGGNGERVCPEPYFTKDAQSSILRLIHKDHPDWQMCYQ